MANKGPTPWPPAQRIVIRVKLSQALYAVNIWSILAIVAAVTLAPMSAFGARVLVVNLAVVSWGLGKKLCS